MDQLKACGTTGHSWSGEVVYGQAWSHTSIGVTVTESTELSSVLLVNTDWAGLYYCRHTNYHHASHFYCVPFSTKPKHSAKQLLAVDLSYGWLYPSKHATDCFMIFARLDRVLFSCLERSVEQVLTTDIPLPVLLALADYWSRWVWIISQVATNTRIHPGYQLNCARQSAEGGL